MRGELIDGGELIARYFYAERDGHRVIDWIELHVAVERAVPVFRARFPGHRIAAPEALGRALVGAGGVPARHAHRYERGPLDGPVEVPPGVRLTPVDRHATDLLEAFHAGYAPGHPDLVEGEDVETELADMLGILLPEPSALAVDADDRVVGAILVGDTDEGPLVLTVFRDPKHPGTGKALLRHALASGLPKLSLVVTHGNPAERLYRRLGFEKTYTAFSVDL